MTPRPALQAAAAFVVAAAVLFVLEILGLGLPAPPAETDDLARDLVASFRFEREAYLTWGLWSDVAQALAFLALIAAAPALRDVGRARPALVAGAAVVVAGAAIEVSQLTGAQIAQASLDNDLMADFTAGNVARIAVATTGAFVYAAGLLVVAVGALQIARDTPDRRWAGANAAFAAALVLYAVAIVALGPVVAQAATALLVVGALGWIAIALGQIDEATGV